LLISIRSREIIASLQAFIWIFMGHYHGDGNSSKIHWIFPKGKMNKNLKYLLSLIKASIMLIIMQLNSSATITFFGILRTAGGISAGFSTMLAGWLCNKLRNTR
jgi:hypothetical protein